MIRIITETGKPKEVFMWLWDAGIQPNRNPIKFTKLLNEFNLLIHGIKKNRSKYLSGFLYWIGGILKLLGLSYWHTKFP